MNHARILSKLLNEPWAIEPHWIETMVAIVDRKGDVAALQAREGKPLHYTYNATHRDNVAILPVTGPIFPRANMMTEMSGATSLELLSRDFVAALDNEDIDTILLKIDSPGGNVSGVDEMHQLIRQSSKQVVAHISGTGASAAYWLASGADKIYISPTSAVGSIGVVYAQRKQGKDDTIELVNSASPRKRIDAESDDGQAQIVSLLDDIAEVFIGSVAEGRGVSPETVVSKFGQGGMLIGQKALDVGMVDGLCSFEALMSQLTGQSDDLNGGHQTMTSTELKEKHPALYEAMLAEGRTQAKAELQPQIDALSKDNKSLQAAVEEKDAHIADLSAKVQENDKQEAIRKEKAIAARAAAIRGEKLTASVIPTRLHPKVAANLNHDTFVNADTGVFDESAYAASVDAEISDWAESFSAQEGDSTGSGSVQGVGGAGEEGTTVSNNQAVVDKAANSLLAHLNINTGGR